MHLFLAIMTMHVLFCFHTGRHAQPRRFQTSSLHEAHAPVVERAGASEPLREAVSTSNVRLEPVPARDAVEIYQVLPAISSVKGNPVPTPPPQFSIVALKIQDNSPLIRRCPAAIVRNA
jgi:hypothetical protein